MQDRELQSRLLPTPLVASFVGRAHDGDLFDVAFDRRAAAWAHWAVTHLAEFKGYGEREYVGLTLPGKFHDPRGTVPSLRPHLEIPQRILDRPDAEFPERLAVAGNGLVFPWWLFGEVTALRRALFATPAGSVGSLTQALERHRSGLVTALHSLSSTLEEGWAVIEGLLVTSPDGLVPDVTGDFDTAEIADFFPPAERLGLTVVFDEKLRESNGPWASRRVGVWQLRGSDNGVPFALGAVTPRLTFNSLFGDPLFIPEREGAAALLVRGLVLRRLVRSHLQAKVPGAVRPDPDAARAPFLRAIVAKVGAKLPEASVEAAVNFLQTFPSGEDAFAALEQWAADGYLLTVSRDGFLAAHTNARRFMRRAEPPERDDINVILPLAWDKQNRVVRVTFSRPTET